MSMSGLRGQRERDSSKGRPVIGWLDVTVYALLNSLNADPVAPATNEPQGSL